MIRFAPARTPPPDRRRRRPATRQGPPDRRSPCLPEFGGEDAAREIHPLGAVKRERDARGEQARLWKRLGPPERNAHRCACALKIAPHVAALGGKMLNGELRQPCAAKIGPSRKGARQASPRAHRRARRSSAPPDRNRCSRTRTRIPPSASRFLNDCATSTRAPEDGKPTGRRRKNRPIREMGRPLSVSR